MLVACAAIGRGQKCTIHEDCPEEPSFDLIHISRAETKAYVEVNGYFKANNSTDSQEKLPEPMIASERKRDIEEQLGEGEEEDDLLPGRAGKVEEDDESLDVELEAQMRLPSIAVRAPAAPAIEALCVGELGCPCFECPNGSRRQRGDVVGAATSETSSTSGLVYFRTVKVGYYPDDSCSKYTMLPAFYDAAVGCAAAAWGRGSRMFVYHVGGRYRGVCYAYEATLSDATVEQWFEGPESAVCPGGGWSPDSNEQTFVFLRQPPPSSEPPDLEWPERRGSVNFTAIREGHYPNDECAISQLLPHRYTRIDSCAAAVHQMGREVFVYQQIGSLTGACFAYHLDVTDSLLREWQKDLRKSDCPGGNWIESAFESTYYIHRATDVSSASAVAPGFVPLDARSPGPPSGRSGSPSATAPPTPSPTLHPTTGTGNTTAVPSSSPTPPPRISNLTTGIPTPLPTGGGNGSGAGNATTAPSSSPTPPPTSSNLTTDPTPSPTAANVLPLPTAVPTRVPSVRLTAAPTITPAPTQVGASVVRGSTTLVFNGGTPSLDLTKAGVRTVLGTLARAPVSQISVTASLSSPRDRLRVRRTPASHQVQKTPTGGTVVVSFQAQTQDPSIANTFFNELVAAAADPMSLLNAVQNNFNSLGLGITVTSVVLSDLQLILGTGSGLSSSSGTGSRTASATDDPHVENLAGERFQVKQPGGYSLIRVPPEETFPVLMKLAAKIRPDVSDPCRLYIKGVAIGGRWLGENIVQVLPLERDRPGDNTAGRATTNPFRIRIAHPAGNATLSWEELDQAKGGARVLGGGAAIQAVLREELSGVQEGRAFKLLVGAGSKKAEIIVAQASHQALNVHFAKAVHLHSHKVGGLMGTQKHDEHIEKATEGCRHRTTAWTHLSNTHRASLLPKRSIMMAVWH